MKSVAMFVAILVIFFMQGPASIAGAEDAGEPHFVKGKFELPLNIDTIKEHWKASGYFKCEYDGVEKGWTSELPERHKGEHTHSWYLLFAGKSGKMEFIIQGQRFVLQPGDELYYPKNAVMAARNLHDGRSEWFNCWKHY